jgi:hypothetical protein
MRLKLFSPVAAARPLRQRNTLVAWIRLTVRAVAILAIVVTVVVVGAVVMVLVGRTDFGFVRDRIAATLTANLGPGYSVAIKRAVMDTDPVLGLVIRVDDIVVRDSHDTVVVDAPETRFVIDPYSLLRLHVDIRAVELNAPQLSFVRASDGPVRLGVARDDVALQSGTTPPTAAGGAGPVAADVAEALPQAEPGDAAAATAPAAAGAAKPAAGSTTGGDPNSVVFPDLVAALKILDRGMEPPIESATAAGFQRLSVVNGSIAVWDAAQNEQRRFSSTDLTVNLDPRTSALTVNFSTSGYSGRWSATIERDLDANSGGHAISAVFSQLTPADLSPTLGDDKGMFVADVPLYGRATMHVNAAGDVEDANARIDVGAGTLRFREDPESKQESVLLDEATIRLHWDIPNKAVIIDPSTFFFGNTRGVVTGTIKPDGDPSAGRYAFDFESPGTVMAPSDSRAPPMVAQRISLSGTADLRQRTLTVSNAVIVTATGSVAAAGRLGFVPGKTPSLALAASFSPMPVTTLKTMWIPFISPGARHWVMEHILSGQLTAGSFETSVPAGVLWGKPVALPEKAMRLDMQLKDVTFTTVGKVPAITKAAGHVVLSGSTFGVDITTGQLSVPQGTVQIDNGAFAVPNVASRPAQGIVEFQAHGPIAAIGQITDSDPINALQERGMTASDLSGTADASLSVRFPLREQIGEGDVDWKLVAKTKKAASKAPIDGRIMTDADVTLTVTPDDFTVYGKAKIDGVAADVSMAMPAAGAKPKPGERQVRLVLDDAARKKLGVGLENVLSGTVTALVTDANAGAQHYDLDLRRARIVLDAVGWSKGIGVPATLSFDLVKTNDGQSLENLVLKGDGFGLSGSAKLDSSFNLLSAQIDNLSLHAGDSISLRLTRSSAGYAISARGTSFDVRGLLTQIRDHNDQAGVGSNAPDIAVDAHVDKLIGFNQEVITGTSTTMVSVGGETQKLAFSGKIAGSDVSIDYAVAGNGTRLDVNSGNAGHLLSFVNLYTHVDGGVLGITGRGSPNGPMVGTMQVSNFYVVNEPAMARVGVGRNSPGGAPDGFDPSHVHFDRMVARFSKTARAVVIEDALLRGAAIGATFSGRYDLPGAAISVSGTYLPAYAFNNLFSRIPIVGIIAGGGLTEGLIGVTFKIEGPIAEPRVFFNPLSAVAPGIFRKIFEFQP